MNTDGWYITITRAPGGFEAGQRCWAIMYNGTFQQGFRLTQVVDAFTWGPLNGKGWLSFRRGSTR